MLLTLRASVRLVLFFILSLLTVLAVAAGRLTVGLVSTTQAVRWKNAVIGLWATLVAKLIGLKIIQKGTPPSPPFFLVSNHLSYIDVIPLWKYLNGTFVAKSEVQSWPFFGWATQILGVLFINRENMLDTYRMNQKIAQTITDAQGVILFPEGTSTKGEQVAPFNAPLLEYPASSQMPVHHATLSYRTLDSRWPTHLNICWWGDMPFFSHFWELLKMPGFEVEITFSTETTVESDRKKLAKSLHKRVANDFLPVVEKEQEPQEHTNGE